MIPASPWPVSSEVYHATRFWPDDDGVMWPLVSSSTLKRWRATPGPGALAGGNGKTGSAQAFGTVLHAYWLERPRYDFLVGSLPQKDRWRLVSMISAVEQAEPGTHGEQLRKMLATSAGFTLRSPKPVPVMRRVPVLVVALAVLAAVLAIQEVPHDLPALLRLQRAGAVNQKAVRTNHGRGRAERGPRRSRPRMAERGPDGPGRRACGR